MSRTAQRAAEIFSFSPVKTEEETNTKLKCEVADDGRKKIRLPITEQCFTSHEADMYDVQLQTGILFGDRPRESISTEEILSVSRSCEPFLLRRHSQLQEYQLLHHDLANLLYEYFGDEALDLCVSLVICALKDAEQLLPTPTPEKVRRDIENRFVQNGSKAVITDERKTQLLNILLDEHHFSHLRKKFGDERFLKIIWRVLKEKRSVRELFMHVLQHKTQLPKRTMISAFVQVGTRFLESTPEITNTEYACYLGSDERVSSKNKEATEEQFLYQRFIDSLVEESFGSDIVLPISERLDCEGLRRRLEYLRKNDSKYAVAAHERQIADTAYTASVRYSFDVLNSHETAKLPGYQVGSPVHLMENRYANCFMGLWLMAALMKKSGIAERQLQYCKIHQLFSGLLGNHGALLLGTETKDIYVYDWGSRIGGRSFPLGLGKSPKRINEIKQLLEGSRDESILFELDMATAKNVKTHPSMQIMPLLRGLSSNYLLNIGVSFYEEGKWKEAKKLFEWGLTFNPKDIDLLYYSGLISFKSGALEEAEKFFGQAIRLFDGHLRSHFALGEIGLARGDFEMARKHMQRVANDPHEVFEDLMLQAEAKKYSSLQSADMAKLWTMQQYDRYEERGLTKRDKKLS